MEVEDGNRALHLQRWVVACWLIVLCIFLVMGAVRWFSPAAAGRMRPFFPLLGCMTSGADAAAETLKVGSVEEAVQAFCDGLMDNGKPD